MNKFPLYFIKKLTAHDLGFSKGELYKRACYFSCQKEPIEKFYQSIVIGDLKETDPALKFEYLYQLPNNLGFGKITLSVRKYRSLVFELAFKKAIVKKMQLQPNDIMVIEQSEKDTFSIRIVNEGSGSYQKINEMIQGGNLQIVLSNNPI